MVGMPAETLAEMLRRWRARALLSQEELAARAGLGVRTVRRFETEGTRRPHGFSVRALADALDLSDAERAELIAAAGSGETAAMEVPMQLPPPVRRFFGRSDELKQLNALLDQGNGLGSTVVITAIGGTAGIGKTTLALHWSRSVAERFPDGQLYVNLHGFDPGGQVTEPAAAVHYLLESLGIPPQRIPADPQAQQALYRTAMAGRRMLVVLDNARDSGQVRPLLPGVGDCVVVVTSRRQLTGLASEDAQLINLDLLSTSEAREFLAHRLGPERVETEREAVDDIITRCARLPLALAVAAARAAAMAHLSLASLAAQLSEDSVRLDLLAGDDPVTDVRAVFSWSYRGLDPGAARLFRLLGLHPGPDLGVAAAASLAGAAVARVRLLLDELVRASLVVERAPGRYTMHDLLKVYAMELADALDGKEIVRASRVRMLDYYTHGAFAANSRLPSKRERSIEPAAAADGVVVEAFDETDAALAWFADELPVLLAAVRLAAGEGFDRHTCWLSLYLVPFLMRRGPTLALLATQPCAVRSAERLGDPAARANAHRGLGSAYIRLGRYAEADIELQRALDFYRQAGDVLGQALTHNNRVHLFNRPEQAQRFIDECAHALALYRAIGHREGEATSLSNMGWGHSLLGDHRQAVVSCEQAIAILQEIGSRGNGISAAWDSLGYAHHHLGEHQRAIECYRNALAHDEGVADLYIVFIVLDHLGDAYQAVGEVGAARREWRAALDILEELDHPDAARLRTKLRA